MIKIVLKYSGTSVIFLTFVSLFNVLSAQTLNKYGLLIISRYEDYEKSVHKDSLNTLINISKTIPNIRLDIKYATTDNFLKEAVYPNAVAFARMSVVAAIKNVETELEKRGLGLKIFDAYRPYSVTEYFFEKTHDTVFVALPWRGSRHNRGCAVDLTMVNLKTGKEVKMPTKFDDFTNKAHPDYMNLTKKAIRNRSLLINTMEKYGFKVYYAEWWHFDYQGWEKFDLMDIPFDLLIKFEK
jgi:zinc D-Ala-D-Ala dipeptidase